MPRFRPPEVILLSGPTAGGKSAVALVLAERLGGEIVSADSVQVYRGMDVGTAKPTAGERARVRHHLVDVADPDRPFDVAQWLRAARAAATEILARGRVAIVCGGTGFYLDAWRRGLPRLPPGDPELREELERTPLEELLRELAGRDPATYGRIDRRNPRRVVRAVEIIRLTGCPVPPPVPGEAAAAEPILVLRRDPADLRARIERRVDAMFAAGLVEETRRLLDLGLDRNPNARSALGYRQVIELLRGERDLPSAIQQVKVRTWQYARRQMTWFRHHPPVEWIDVAPDELPHATVERILQRNAG